MSLDERIRTTIDGAAAPIDRSEIGSTMITEPQSARRRLVPAIAVTIAVGGLAALVLAMSVRDDQAVPATTGPGGTQVAPTTSTVPFVPPTTTAPPAIVPAAPVAPMGTEYPIEQIVAITIPDLGTLDDPLPIDARSPRLWQTADATLFSVRTVIVQADRIYDGQCDGTLDLKLPSAPPGTPDIVGSGYGCSPIWIRQIQPNVGGGWNQPDDQPGHGTWQWSNVPADTDFVQYTAGDQHLWQRPIDGMAAFPATQEDMSLVASATAYRADGAVLATANAATVQAGSVAVDAADPSAMNGSRLPDGLLEQGRRTAVGAFTDCLRSEQVVVSTIPDSGAQYVQLADGEQGEAIWQGCLTSAQASLDEFVDQHWGAANPSAADAEPTVGAVASTSATTPVTVQPDAAPLDSAPSPCPGNVYAVQMGDSVHSIAERFGIGVDELFVLNPGLEQIPLTVGHSVQLPCNVAMTSQSKDRSGLHAFVDLALASQQQPDFTATNAVVAASDAAVYVIIGGSVTDGTGAFELFSYDRATSALRSTEEAPVEGCAGPIVLVDDPGAPFDAQPFVCTADGVHHTIDLFNGHPNAD